MGNRGAMMSVKEADRAAVIREVVEKRLRQRTAAERLGLGVRQVKRLARLYRERGAAGLASGRRGGRANNAIDDGVRREVVGLVRERYRDFGPTFAREKLVEVHGHRLSVETLRKWMIADGLWRAKARREARVHQSRPRRECVGDLVQIDGSPHDWVRGPGAKMHTDRIRRRRDHAAAGDALRRRGDDRGVHGDDARASGVARSGGGVLLGQVRCVPCQQEG